MSSAREKLDNTKFVILVVISTFLVLAGMYILNDIVLTIRLVELQASIRESNRELSRADFIAMAAHFKLSLHLYMGLLSEKDFDKEELDMIYLSTGNEIIPKITIPKYGDASKPIIAVINLIHILLGKPRVEAIVNNRTDVELAVAYYFERNKRFKKALSVYEEAFTDGKVLTDKIPVVLLHQGFCNGVIGEYESAKSTFIRIVKNYHGGDESTAAALMLQYLETFLSEIDKVKKSTDTELVRAEKLYKLMAYKDALSILAESGDGGGKEQEREKYLEARCREETGENDVAVRIYQEIILNDHESEAARDANRRLLVMSSADDQAANIKTLSEKNNELIKDPGFNQLVDTANKIKSNRNNLAPEDRNNLDRKISQDKSENLSGRVTFDNFVNDAIKSTGETINKEILEASVTTEPVKAAVVTALPAPRLTLIPPPKETSSPIPESIAVPSPTKQPAQPFTKSYKDKSGNVVKVESFDAEGNLEMTINYEYDSNGNPVKVHAFDKNGKPMEN